MLYTANNSALTPLQLFFTTLRLLGMIEILTSDEYSVTIQLKNTDIDFFLLKQHLEALLECQLVILRGMADICSFSIVS